MKLQVLGSSARTPPLKQLAKGVSDADRELIRRANLEYIQQVDSFADEVLASFPNVGYYEFSRDEGVWAQSAEMGGTLLLYHRLDRPYFSLMVAKVESVEVHVYPLSDEVRIKSAPPHVQLFKPNATTIALWMGDEAEGRRLYALLKVVRRLQAISPAQWLLYAFQLVVGSGTTVGEAKQRQPDKTAVIIRRRDVRR